MDGLLLFDSAAAITASATTVASTNVIDLVNARDMGIGDPALKIRVQPTVAFATTNSATLSVQVQGSTDNTTFTTMVSSVAGLTGGNLQTTDAIDLFLPRIGPDQALPRYLRLLYTVATGVFSLGSVTSFIVLDRQDYINYPAGINVAN